MAFNPYAPPEAEIAPKWRGDARFQEHRFSVGFLIVIAVFTLGLYLPFWLLRRRSLVDNLDTDHKLGLAIPLVATIVLVGGTAMTFYEAFTGGRDDVATTVSRFGGIAIIFACFRVRRVLIEYTSGEGRPREISGLGTFFLGGLYLQHKINQIADELKHTP